MAPARKRKRKPTAREVLDLETYEGLKGLLEELGWDITISRNLDGPGGDCIVRGARRAILSGRLAIPERIGLLLDAAGREDLSRVFVRPDLRDLIERSTAAAPARGSGALSGASGT